MKIMVCHDASRKSQLALEKAVELFRPQKPEIILITVVEGRWMPQARMRRVSGSGVRNAKTN